MNQNPDKATAKLQQSGTSVAANVQQHGDTHGQPSLASSSSPAVSKHTFMCIMLALTILKIVAGQIHFLRPL